MRCVYIPCVVYDVSCSLLLISAVYSCCNIHQIPNPFSTPFTVVCTLLPHKSWWLYNWYGNQNLFVSTQWYEFSFSGRCHLQSASSALLETLMMLYGSLRVTWCHLFVFSWIQSSNFFISPWNSICRCFIIRSHRPGCLHFKLDFLWTQFWKCCQYWLAFLEKVMESG